MKVMESYGISDEIIEEGFLAGLCEKKPTRDVIIFLHRAKIWNQSLPDTHVYRYLMLSTHSGNLKVE
jgi:hypothetical protein